MLPPKPLARLFTPEKEIDAVKADVSLLLSNGEDDDDDEYDDEYYEEERESVFQQFLLHKIAAGHQKSFRSQFKYSLLQNNQNSDSLNKFTSSSG